MSWSLFYLLDCLAVVSFEISYYKNCYRRGYRIDIWHAQLFLWCVLPNFIMLTFSRSDLNGIVLGQDLAAVMSVLPYVFLVTVFGYLSILAGGTFWTLKTGIGLRKQVTQVLDIVPRASLMLMSSRSVLVFQALLCFCLQIAILLVYFRQSGFGFDLRAYTMANPELRPVALIISTYSGVIASHCLARYIDRKERILAACTILLTIGIAFFGARSSILFIFLNVFLCYLVKLRARIGLFRLAAIGSLIVVAGLYLGNARAGEYSVSGFFRVFASLVLYGNTFSDLRDFAWVYADWNHVFWGGKTYLAAIFAFVPRFASSFRDTWGLGVATATTVGFDPQTHPGLRPGVFGESYFNFGWFGVLVLGLALGIVLRRVDMDVKSALASRTPSMMRAFASTTLLGVAGSIAITAGFSGIYILIAIYSFSWLCLQVVRLAHPRVATQIPAK